MKKISILILVIAFCTVLVGCGNKEENMTDNNYNENVTQNQENTTNNDNDEYVEENTNNENTNNYEETSGDEVSLEAGPIDIRYEGDTITANMLGLYDIVYKFEGEKVVECQKKYNFYSELALNSFVEGYKDAPEGKVTIDGMTVTIKDDESELENLTRSQIIEEFKLLQSYYSTAE